MQIRMCLGTVALILASAVSVTPASSQNTRDALADGVMSICADPYIYPSSSRGYPPGYDIEILEAIARTGGYRSDRFWVNSGTIGGLGRALRNSIAGGYCDVKRSGFYTSVYGACFCSGRSGSGRRCKVV